MEADSDSVEELEKVDALEERPRTVDSPEGEGVILRESSSKTFNTTTSGSLVACVLLVDRSTSWNELPPNGALVLRVLFRWFLIRFVLRKLSS